MDRAALAERLAAADAAGRAALLARYADLADVELAQDLKALYFQTNQSDPQQAAGAAAALTDLAAAINHPEIQALARWTSGLAALQHAGQPERAIELLDQAAARFEALVQPESAAATQVSKIHALAMIGRYDEAIDCGLRARDVLLAHGDTLAAGRIELNLGNIYHRRDQYREAERLYNAARERFATCGDQRLLTYADNGLANVLSLQHNFRTAAQLYEQALAGAEATGQEVVRAAIECNLGSLALFQGRYDRALDYLELSRRRYTDLDMPHESAVAEQELADAYLDLNLAPEAAAIYARVSATFAELGMRAEHARALLNHGRACLILRQIEQARALLAQAGRLYAAEGNPVGVALVTLAEAQTAYAVGDYAAVAEAAAHAEQPLAEAGAWGRLLLARWLRSEAARALGHTDAARSLLEATLRDADLRGVPHMAQRCHTSLGLMAEARGDVSAAKAAFRRAVDLLEAMRTPLPADEFRAAFSADKLTAYTGLVRLCLADSTAERTTEALGYIERARALLDMIGGANRLPSQPRDAFEGKLMARLDDLREDLNWFYSQINRAPAGETPPGPTAMEDLHHAVREREAEVAEISRQIQQHNGAMGGVGARHGVPQHPSSLDIAALKHDLGANTALVEYFDLDGELVAFVVTDAGIEMIRGLGRLDQAEALLGRFRFQIGTLRHGTARLGTHLDQLARRAHHYLRALYDLLLRPIEDKIGTRRLVVVPHRGLHYVPFHALHDGAEYVVERREVCYAPSASVLRACLARPRPAPDRALILGVPDERAPRVRDEVMALAPLFPDAKALLGDQASLAALRARAPDADVLHMACHGQFRPDNPLFSSLRLADGWLTVRDAYGLDLRCGLVTLSACETGMSAVTPGEDLAGLARGFFAAGAPALLVSLWAVDDDSTAALMTDFYKRLRAGANPAAALRGAQLALLEHHPHPFFWSPFILLGRW